MHAFVTASVLALTATTFASPAARRQQAKRGLATVDVPTATDVQNAINDWNTDVEAVNSFLERAPGELTDLATLATDAQSIADTFATDEPNQLKTLINWFTNDANNRDSNNSPDAFRCATNDLAVGLTSGSTTFNFESLVLDVFNNIVADAQAGNAGAVQDQLDVVNSYRCCNVLPDLDIIWLDSAVSANLQTVTPITGGVPIKPARPSFCAALSCPQTFAASTCFQQDNGRFGAVSE